MDPVAVAASVGAADAGMFLLRRPKLFVQNPARALSTLAFFGGWIALRQRASREGPLPSEITVALASVVALGSTAALTAHLEHGVASPRVFVSAAAGAVALTGTLLRR